MPNPIIIIFEYHQVPAGEILFQSNFPDLLKHGYKTYLDEEASNISLNRKLEMVTELVDKAQEIPEDSEEIWQKEIVTIRKNTVDLLVANKVNYFAYDIPQSTIELLFLQNIDVLRSHPKGMAQGVNDLLSGKIPHRMEPFKERVAYQNEAFAKNAVHAKDGVVCIAGIYHANHLQSYLRSKFPEQDVLTFFPYQGVPFEIFEEEARNPETNSSVFPHKARLINMDTHGEETRRSIINDDLDIYKKIVDQLQKIELSLNKNDISKDTIQEIQKELNNLKAGLQNLKSLNNVELYLFTIDIYHLKCAIEIKDLSYIKTNYNLIKKNSDTIPKSPIKDKLIVMCKEIVCKYQAEKELTPKNVANVPQAFFEKNTTTPTPSTNIVNSDSMKSANN